MLSLMMGLDFWAIDLWVCGLGMGWLSFELLGWGVFFFLDRTGLENVSFRFLFRSNNLSLCNTTHVSLEVYITWLCFVRANLVRPH